MSDKDLSVDKRPDSVRNKIRIEALEQRVKGVEQQLTKIINLGPTITQKKMWLDELFDLTNEETKLILNKLRKLK